MTDGATVAALVAAVEVAAMAAAVAVAVLVAVAMAIQQRWRGRCGSGTNVQHKCAVQMHAHELRSDGVGLGAMLADEMKRV